MSGIKSFTELRGPNRHRRAKPQPQRKWQRYPLLFTLNQDTPQPGWVVINLGLPFRILGRPIALLVSGNLLFPNESRMDKLWWRSHNNEDFGAKLH